MSVTKLPGDPIKAKALAIPPLPTMYKGTIFRSRLEAKFAVLFDSFGWPWLYEPIDLSWYIPDFVLTFEAGHIAVEVKPETDLGSLKAYAQRIVQSGWDAEILVLGASMHAGDVIGINGEHAEDGEVILGPATAFRCINCGRISVLNEDQGWRCRVSGCDGGNAHRGQLEHGELESLWVAAGNRVQWKAPNNPEAAR